MDKAKKGCGFQLALIGLLCWGTLIYSNVFYAPFVFDDAEFIQNNPFIRSLFNPELWNNPLYLKRFVVFVTFSINYLIHGTHVLGYHVVNIGIHLLTTLNVIWFCHLLLRTPRVKNEPMHNHPWLFALVVGWIFMVHPIQTESVTYLSQRFESLATLFYMASICFYLSARLSDTSSIWRILQFFLSGIALMLGVFTKETVYTAPLIFLLLERMFLYSKKNELGWKKHYGYIFGIFTLLIFIFTTSSTDLVRLFSVHERMGITSYTYLLTQLTVIPRYLLLIFFPLNQNLDHDISWVSVLLNGSVVLGVVVVLTIALLIKVFWNSQPLLSFGLLWFGITLSVTSSIIPLKDPMVEHRLYLPLIGLLVAVYAFFYNNFKSNNKLLTGSLLVTVLLVFSFLTFQRNHVWADEIRLWTDVVNKSPNKPRGYVNLGLSYRKKGELNKALHAYKTALDLRNEYPEPRSKIYNNIGAVYGILKQYEDQIKYSLKALELDPRNYQAMSNLGYAYSAMGEYNKAVQYGRKAIRKAPNLDEAWNNLGVTYGRMNLPHKAIKMFKKALAINPLNKEAKSNLEFALKGLGVN